MQQIIGFIIRNGLGLLFLLLLGCSLWLTVNHYSFHKSKFINSSNAISGTVYSQTSSVSDYFRLKKDNEALYEENLRLKKLLLNEENSHLIDENAAFPDHTIQVIPAKVIRNSYRSQQNYITIKGGEKQGIKPDMGVINDKGIVGFVEYTSDNYATVLSVLNTKFQTVAKIKKNNHFGTLSWNGKATGFMQLTDIPRLTDLKKGDTIVTGFSSKAFPENIPIGEVETMFLDKKTNIVTLEVRLFNDMTNLNYVYITNNLHKEEIQTLEEKTAQDE